MVYGAEHALGLDTIGSPISITATAPLDEV